MSGLRLESRQTYFDHHGRPLRLGREIGRGGEGIVSEVEAAPHIVAKIYSQKPDDKRTDKLNWMVRASHEDLASACAWPTATLHEVPAGPLVGIVMPRIPGHYKDIHLLYTLQSRVRDFPSATWDFLVHAAWNCAVVFESIQAHGHLVGDVNEKNVMVSSRDATVRLIDCDSFQIRARDRTFTCNVGVPLYTPPELQGRTLGERTALHDDFGLAVLIFQLLFVGRHPFAGRSLSSNDLSPEDAIKAFRFAYSGRAPALRVQRPPLSPALDLVPSLIADMFETAFAPQGTVRRPTPSDWKMALSQLRNGLSTCRLEASHKYSRTVSACPWCEIAAASNFQFDYFIGVSAASTFTISLADMDALLHQLQALTPPQLSIKALPGSARSSPQRASSRAHSLQRAVRPGIVASIITGTLAAVLVPLGADRAAFLIGACSAGALVVFIGLLVYRLRLSEAGRLASRLRGELRDAVHTLEDTRTKARARIEEYEVRSQKVRQAIDAARRSYADLKHEYESDLLQLQRDRQRLQRRQFLEQFSVDEGDISKVGRGRRTNLRSHGIETAYDVLRGNLDVPGFGPKLRNSLISWARQIEARFVFDAQKGVPEGEKRLLAYKYRQKQASVHSAVERQVAETRAARSRVEADVGGLRGPIDRQEEKVGSINALFTEAARHLDLGSWPNWAIGRFWKVVGGTWLVVLCWIGVARFGPVLSATRTEVVVPPPAQQIQVSIVGAPEGASIRVDQQVRPTHFSLDASRLPHQLEVVAAGFSPFRDTLAGDRDATVVVKMLPAKPLRSGRRDVHPQDPANEKQQPESSRGRVKHDKPTVEDAVDDSSEGESSVMPSGEAAGEPFEEAPSGKQGKVERSPKTGGPKKWVDPFAE